MAEKDEIKNCPNCKKPLKKSKKYYRNGGYFCNKNCFAAKQKADLEAAQGAK